MSLSLLYPAGLSRNLSFLLLAGLALSLVRCGRPEPPTSTYRSPAPMEELAQLAEGERKQVLELALKLEEPQLPAGRPLAARFAFAVGDPANGLKVQAGDMPPVQDSVTLPHSNNLTQHTPFWYRTRVALQEPCYLVGWFDDGAQLFVDDKQLDYVGFETFLLEPTPGKDSAVVTLRVLNAAAQGGLAEAVVYSQATYENWRREYQLYLRKRSLAQKLGRLLVDVPGAEEAIRAALTAEAEAPLQQAEELLAPYVLPFVSPYVVQPRANTAIVSFQDPSNESYTLLYGLAPDRLSQVNLALPHKPGLFQFILPNLAPNTRYYYRFLSRKYVSPVLSFRTLHLADTTRFGLWGDSQGGWKTFRRLAKQMARQDYDFALGVGDLVNRGADSLAWQAFFNALSPLADTTAVYLVGGNHDYDGYYTDLQSHNLLNYGFPADSLPYTSWRSGPAAFIALDPNTTYPVGLDTAQLAWLKAEMRKPSWMGADWRFLLIHQPLYTQSWPGYTGNQRLRQQLAPILKNQAVDFILSGHTHAYERLSTQAVIRTASEARYFYNRLNLVISGGGGGALEPEENNPKPVMDTLINQHHFVDFTITRTSCTLRCMDLEGAVLDSLQVHKPENQSDLQSLPLLNLNGDSPLPN